MKGSVPCPQCGNPETDLLSTTNDYRNYCPACDVRFSDKGEFPLEKVEATPMKTLVLKVELRGENINVDLDSPIIVGVKALLEAAIRTKRTEETLIDLAQWSEWATGVTAVEVRFQFSEESID